MLSKTVDHYIYIYIYTHIYISYYIPACMEIPLIILREGMHRDFGHLIVVTFHFVPLGRASRLMACA